MEKLKPKQGFTAIELDTKSLKLAQVSILDKPKLTSLFFVKDIDLGLAKTKDKIKSELAKNKIEVASCLICLPRQAVTTRYLKLPSKDEEEIARMIKLQIPKLLPYPASDIVSSFRIIDSRPEGFSHCLVILAQQNLVRHFYSLAESLGMKPEKIILSSQAVVNLASTLKNNNFQTDTVLLVEVDSACADIIIIREGQLVFTRSVGRQLKDREEKVSWQNKLQDEIKRSLEIASKEIESLKIDRLIFSGSESTIRDLDKTLSLNFSFPTEIVSLIDNELVKDNLQAEQMLKMHDVSFVSVIGAALNKDKFSWDLLPMDIKDKLNLRIIRQKSRRLLFLFTLGLLLLFALFAKHIYDKSRLLKLIERQIKVLSPQANTQDEIIARFETVRQELRQSVFISELLKQIYNIIPQDISLTNLDIERDKTLILKGQTYNFSSVSNLYNLLEKSENFKNVRLRYVTKRKIRESELTDFQIDCTLRSTKSK
ncbi:MAG: pilus assembly protein PilM [Candidatus Omnitrophota bacterium]